MRKVFIPIALLMAACAIMFLPYGFRTVSAAPVVIDFENVLPGQLTNQYANLGVTFNQPTLLNYSYMPGFAHSGTKGIEQCYAAEFCSAPIDMNFTTAQRRVKVWVGISSALYSTQTVLMRALNASGVQVGQATAVFNASNAAQPIRVPLEITAASATIRRVLVSYSPTTNATNFLAMDDLEFDTAGPPPACQATVPPTLSFLQPINNLQTVQFNSFMMEARVTSQDPLASTITMTVTKPGGATTTHSLALANGKYGPILMNGVLAAGVNTIKLRFQDCRGAAEATRSITYAPIPDGTRFEMLGIEITQATQTENNTVALIAGKDAVARVFLRIQSPAGPNATIQNVFGRLVAQRRNGTGLGDYLPPGTVYSLNRATINTSADLAAKRGTFNATINFRLPDNWVTAGELHLSFRPEIQGSPSSPSTIPCTTCDNLFPSNSQPRFNTFRPTRPMNLILAPYIYKPNSNPPFPLSAELLFTPAGALQYTNNTYPLPGNFPSDAAGIKLLRILPMQTTTRNMQTSDGKSKFLSDLQMLYNLLKAQGGIPSDTRLLAMVPCGCGGQAYLGGRVAFADTWASENGAVPAGSFEGYGSTWAHELGHSYGREHAGNWHGEAGGGGYDENFPYFHGGIGVPGLALNTFWWKQGGTPFFIPTGTLNPLGNHAHDFMSYGHLDPLNTGLWISPYTYNALYNVFKVNTATFLVKTEATEKLVVSGQIGANGVAELQPFSRDVTAADSGTGEQGEFSLELLDEKGGVLIEHRFDAMAVTHDEAGTLGFNEFVPWRAGAKRIVLKRKGFPLADREVSAHAPKVRLLSPNGGERLANEAKIYWEASDADGDPLTYSVLYNNGEDSIWWPVATDVTANSISVDTSLWAGSTKGRLMVRATDGVNSAEDVSDAGFTVAQKNPIIGVLNEKEAADASQLIGVAYDPEEGLLPASRLIWTSDRDGRIELGPKVRVDKLTAGTHTITLTVTDSQGQTSTTQVKSLVRPRAAKLPER